MFVIDTCIIYFNYSVEKKDIMQTSALKDI